MKTLPKMKRAAQSPELKAVFEKHHQETEGQIERLQQVFDIMGKRATRASCDAIEGIIAEGEEIMQEFKDTVAWMPAYSPARGPSSTTRSPATARLSAGRPNSRHGGRGKAARRYT